MIFLNNNLARKHSYFVTALLQLNIYFIKTAAIPLDINKPDSINTAALTIANGILDYYPYAQAGQPIGVFQSPYYWWQSGAAWGSLVDYWYYTGDDQYVQVVREALLAQVGDHWDYVPINQSMTEGNDDQGFWGITVMAAAERNFPRNPTWVSAKANNNENPKAGLSEEDTKGDKVNKSENIASTEEPSWLYLAQAVFNTMSSRWDESNCGGGLRWQIFRWNSGYDYKNSVSNGCLFHLGARLARYTGNKTYIEWAERVWDWMEEVELIDGSRDYLVVFDGAFVSDECAKVTTFQWSYNAGLMLAGAAYLFNHTGDPLWEARVKLLLNGISVFFEDGVMAEVTCQRQEKCNNDQRSFKAYLARFLGLTGQLVESSREYVDYYLQSSAIAAANSCSGGSDGVTCGLNWQKGGHDGMFGLGEQMSALEVIQNMQYKWKEGPLTLDTGAVSLGDWNAGWKGRGNDTKEENEVIYVKNQVWAAVMTVVFGITAIGLVIFVIV